MYPFDSRSTVNIRMELFKRVDEHTKDVEVQSGSSLNQQITQDSVDDIDNDKNETLSLKDNLKVTLTKFF